MEDDDERKTDAIDVPDELTSADERLALGSDVGGYVIDGELGHGGMGVVYSAMHPVIGKRAAIKVLKPELSKEPTAVERFKLEARAVNQIGHPNIVDIFAFGALSDGRSYYVMDLLVGESLRARLRRSGALHVSEAAAIIEETASALIAAHGKGLVHRDLKPDNIFMVSAPGRWPEVKILDWGLVKLVPGSRLVGKYRTAAGSVIGTPVYMSPEQARASETVDARTDIYALGVMSYELLTGTVPFKKESSIDTLLAHQDEPVPSLRDKAPSLPVELVQLIEAMLEKDPDNRPTLAAVHTVIKRLKGTKIPTMTAAGLSMDVPPAGAATLGDPMSVQLTSPREALPPQPSALPLPPPPDPRKQNPSSPPSAPSSRPPKGGAVPSTLAGTRAPLPTSSTLARDLTPAPGTAHSPSSPPDSASGLARPSSAPSAGGPAVAPRRSRRWIVISIAALIALAIGLAIVLAI